MVTKSLVIQTAFLGDILLSIPLIRKLRELDPDSDLVYLGRKPFGGFLKSLCLVDDVVEFDKKDLSSFPVLRRQLASEKWKWIISPHESIRTHLLVASLKAEEKVGFEKFGNNLVFSKRVVRPMHLPDALRQLSLLAPLNLNFAEEFSTYGSHWSSTSEIPDWASMKVAKVQDFRLPTMLASNFFERPVALLAPGSQWPTKRWTKEGFSNLARMLLQSGHQVGLIGSRDDQEICKFIANNNREALDLSGKTTLEELCAIMVRSRALISNDSGLMHLASVTGLPTVAIFGPTTLELGYRPWQKRSVVVEKPLNCRPCGKHGHVKCPLGTHECMKGLSADHVFEALRGLLP